ncbi:MAG: VOC family protein [Chloroflexaceae bacterium]|jgi:catechol 2,3-dioxygenase-like lactoylglutathione lyase family enzyme|nr:VOC family protein [Chloroflexaceae bacterium]
MSISSIDHIVIAVHNLEQTINDYRELGFTVFPGGEHPGGLSHNALVIFEDGAYFELIAFRQPRAGWRWWELLQTQGEGLVDYALFPSEVERDYERVKARGLPLDGPIDGGRTRPDGQQIAWKNARATTSDLPFLCGDVTPRALRVPEGEVRRHANGVVGIAGITVAVADLTASVARYGQLLDHEPTQRLHLPGLGARLAVFQLGGARVVLAAPNLAQPGTPGDFLRSQLDARGEGPYAVALRTTDQSRQGVLELGLAHGARLELIKTSADQVSAG